MNNEFDELAKGLAQSVSTSGPRKPMKKSRLVKTLALALGCGAVVAVSTSIKAGDTLPANAAALKVTAGCTFAVLPTSDPTVFNHPVDGVAQVSLLGNSHFHGESEAHFPTSPGQPIVIVSTSPWTFTSDNGVDSLEFTVQGTATFDAANPSFANVTYQATIIGGTGAFATASGNATISVTAQFTSATGGIATFTMKGYAITPPSGS